MWQTIRTQIRLPLPQGSSLLGVVFASKDDDILSEVHLDICSRCEMAR